MAPQRGAPGRNAKAHDGRTEEALGSGGLGVGTAEEFLRLAPHEAALVEMKLALARSFRLCRERLRLSQERLAKVIHSSQSRVAKMEAGDPSVSVELLMRALLMLGVRRPDLARIISVRKVEDV